MRVAASPGRFDKAIWVVMALLLLLTALVIWRGDRIGLRVVTQVPAPDGAGISPRTPIRISFDQRIDAATVSPGALALTPSVAGELRAEGEDLLFVPSAALEPDTAYQIEIAPGLKSVQGRLLHEPLRWRFVTGHTSVVYSQVDAAGKEQLMMAAVILPQGESAEEARLKDPRQLSQATHGIWDFSVDGNSGQVVYSSLTAEGTSDLWSVLPGAQEPVLLQACPNAACSTAAFSPDSRLLAFSQRSATGFGAPVVSPPRLLLLDLTSGITATLFADNQQLAFDPRWSYDGRWLSYLSPDLGGVGAYQLENGMTRFYPTTTGETPVWHPQRNEFVFSEMISGTTVYEVHLVLVDPLTETRRDLSLHTQPVEDNSPAYSAGGEWIVFRRKELAGANASLGKQLWRMRADGSDAHPLTQAPEYDHGPPAWSPDNRYLLYHRFPLRGPEVVISVWIMDVESGQSWEVARPGQRPQWVP